MRNPILAATIFLCVTQVGCHGSSTAPVGGSNGCRDSVTLLNPLSGTSKLDTACEPGQEAKSQIAPNNSVIITCTCVRETACRCHPVCDGGACEVPEAGHP